MPITRAEIPLAMSWDQWRVLCLLREREALLAMLRRHNDLLLERLQDAHAR